MGGYDYGKHGDIETGHGGQLYPTMMESPEMRWGFIRKVYVILSIQMLLSVAIGATVALTPRFLLFMATKDGLWAYIGICIFAVILIIPLHMCHNRHPLNLILLALFTVTLSLLLGVAVGFSKGKVVFEAAILTSVVVVGLTLYTFWAAKRGHDFAFLGPFLFAAVLVLLTFSLIQIFFPFGKMGTAIIGCVGALVYSAFIVYDTDNLIKRYDYDEYVPAAVSLYLDIVNLFLYLLTILNALDE